MRIGTIQRHAGMIDIQGVGKQYGNGTYAVKDVDLHIDSGEFVKLLVILKKSSALLYLLPRAC